MDLVKIGKFIAARRKEAGLTQAQLAEKLNLTDRAVSKWETGRAMPDSSVMLKLCEALSITVNDLLCGEALPEKPLSEEARETILALVKAKEESDQKLLFAEVVLVLLAILPVTAAAVAVKAYPVEEWKAALILLASLIPLLTVLPFSLRIEQTAGYYRCKHCGHCHVPSYKSIWMAMHMGRTRYLKCPECRRKSWHKKVLRKKDSFHHSR